jgi:hypothetical protein
MLYGALDVNGFFGMTKAMENGYGSWDMEC